MCGIAGFLDTSGRKRAEQDILSAMLKTLLHRGPDDEGFWVEGACAMGTRRLSILDKDGSNQPLFNEERDLVLVGNGEIFNYIELQQELVGRGHRLSTRGDLETILHLYEDHGPGFVHHVEGQFSVAIYDRKQNKLSLFRDRFGITPLFYAEFDGNLIFASEIKAILRHPACTRRVDLMGLDQIVCFPGLISPRTMFAGINSLRPGHWLEVQGSKLTEHEYWDLEFPAKEFCYNDIEVDEEAEEFLRRFDHAVAVRMRSDRPVGVYLSGGLDSSLVASAMRANQPSGRMMSFSIVFPESRAIDERRFQRLMVQKLDLDHVEVPFLDAQISENLSRMVWHAECPVKETYNTCSMALAKAASGSSVPVVLGGEGADELFGGYPGYRFDSISGLSSQVLDPTESLARERIWGDSSVRYERAYHEFGLWRRRLFSDRILSEFEFVDSLSNPPIRVDRLTGRHPIHQRSYIDCKVRMADHLLGDHGDRMAMAYSVEGRYPFLDRRVVEFVRYLAPDKKVRGLDEKILLKEAAKGRVPDQIVRREKFGFRSPGSAALMKMPNSQFADLLDPAKVERQGYLNPRLINELAVKAREPGGRVNPHAEDDLLLIALTFGMFLDLFKIPDL
jgi:asparagine synthase (glutamine-hydrolysing)